MVIYYYKYNGKYQINSEILKFIIYENLFRAQYFIYQFSKLLLLICNVQSVAIPVEQGSLHLQKFKYEKKLHLYSLKADDVFLSSLARGPLRSIAPACQTAVVIKQEKMTLFV